LKEILTEEQITALLENKGYWSKDVIQSLKCNRKFANLDIYKPSQ
jgi:hypothetical protein